MNEKIIQCIQNNRFLYPIARTIACINDKDIYDLLRGFYGNPSQTQTQSFVLKHYGEKNKNICIYYIEFITKDVGKAGFWAFMKWILDFLFIADFFKCTPIIEIGKLSLYYNGEINGSSNVFEYYFEPVSDIKYIDVYECANVIHAKDSHRSLTISDRTLSGNLYDYNDDTISRWASTYRKYIKLNKPTAEYIDLSIKKIIGQKKTLGIHYRGTDFNVGYWNHPVPVDLNTYIENAAEMYKEGDYEQIFLATDDSRALDQFKNKFDEKLVYFDDVLRGSGDVGVHLMEDKSENHNFQRGLEVLRDTYTLAYCSGLVAGWSNVSYAARYIKRAANEEFDNIKILSNGVYTSDSKKAKKMSRK